MLADEDAVEFQTLEGALLVAHGDRAAGRATVGKLTPSAAGGVGAVIERQDIEGLLAELRARAGPASS